MKFKQSINKLGISVFEYILLNFTISLYLFSTLFAGIRYLFYNSTFNSVLNFSLSIILLVSIIGIHKKWLTGKVLLLAFLILHQIFNIFLAGIFTYIQIENAINKSGYQEFNAYTQHSLLFGIPYLLALLGYFTYLIYIVIKINKKKYKT